MPPLYIKEPSFFFPLSLSSYPPITQLFDRRAQRNRVSVFRQLLLFLLLLLLFFPFSISSLAIPYFSSSFFPVSPFCSFSFLLRWEVRGPPLLLNQGLIFPRPSCPLFSSLPYDSVASASMQTGEMSAPGGGAIPKAQPTALLIFPFLPLFFFFLPFLRLFLELKVERRAAVSSFASTPYSLHLPDSR